MLLRNWVLAHLPLKWISVVCQLFSECDHSMLQWFSTEQHHPERQMLRLQTLSHWKRHDMAKCETGAEGVTFLSLPGGYTCNKRINAMKDDLKKDACSASLTLPRPVACEILHPPTPKGEIWKEMMASCSEQLASQNWIHSQTESNNFCFSASCRSEEDPARRGVAHPSQSRGNQ